jgi:hypothetical protein
MDARRVGPAWWSLVGAVVLLTSAYAIAQMPGASDPGLEKAQRRHEPAGRAPVGPVGDRYFRTIYVRLGAADADGLLYEPVGAARRTRIALVSARPDGNSFQERLGREMSHRGYRVLMVDYHGTQGSPERYAPALSRAIRFMRSLPGVQWVVLVGLSGGGHLLTFYDNVAEHGPAACQDVAKIYPCVGTALVGLSRPDGIALLDATTGAFHTMASLDPAVTDRARARDRQLDMFSAASGYDAAHDRARYSAAFIRRFFAAQSARNSAIIAAALGRLHAIEHGQGRFSDDEPFVIPGMGTEAAGARLYQPDTSFLARTHAPHTLLRSDGSEVEVIVRSIRPPSGAQYVAALGTLGIMSQNTTVKQFLWRNAIRTSADFAVTADGVVGVDWNSSIDSAPGNAMGVTVPALVMVMTCHYLVVPGEIIFDHLASRDKTFAAVEGAAHDFEPCRPEFGDTAGRAYDYLDRWLSRQGRFRQASRATASRARDASTN